MQLKDRYDLIEGLGEGAQGRVFLARQRNSGQRCVIKLYKEATDEAETEVRILKEFGGHSLPYLLDCGEYEGQYAVVMEFVEGERLDRYMKRRGRLTEQETVDIALQISAVLQAFHGHVPQYVYGDLKPQNLMIDAKGKVSLIDFGSVLVCGAKNQRVTGTVGYTPAAEGCFDLPYRDAYALGVLMYEMLTGVGPMSGIEDQKANIRHICPETAKIMQKATRLDPAFGYQTAVEMYEELKQCKPIPGHAGQRKDRKGKECYYIMDMKRLFQSGLLTTMVLAIVLIVSATFFFREGTQPESIYETEWSNGAQAVVCEDGSDLTAETVYVTTKSDALGKGGNGVCFQSLKIKEVKRP
ncbi:MAG: serine/threonine protein kinase [Lachnospiraceae bacterium]|nr:serine/threonine protein kinase [Lachnospiraceae bacterium]